MRKVVEYKTITVPMRRFDERINHSIKDGWQPIGGIAVDANNGYCSQSMVKYEEEPKVTAELIDKEFGTIADLAVPIVSEGYYGQTPEQKFKAERWEYYGEFLVDTNSPNPVVRYHYDLPGRSGHYYRAAIEDIINQEYRDYLDELEDMGTRSM